MRSVRDDDDDFPDAPTAEWPSVARVLKQVALLPAASQPGACNEDMLSLALSVAAGAELYGKLSNLAPLAAELAHQVMLFEPFADGNEKGAIAAVRAFLLANGKVCVTPDDVLTDALSQSGEALTLAIQAGLRDNSKRV
ncbi:MAG TPA: hypothetical protein PLA85_12105 [Micropepsaceae bacterium]|nr:hypothetical protein [Micropepsaceae bacterium]